MGKKSAQLSEQEKAYRRIVKRVEKRFEVRTQFVGHVIAFIVAVFIGTQILPNVLFWRIVFAAWLMGVAVHGVNVLFFELRERAIDRALEQAGLVDPGKLKNHDTQTARLVHLSEDGELQDVDGPFIEPEYSDASSKPTQY